jgi:hypothetical protein
MTTITPHSLCWRRILDNGSFEFATAIPSVQRIELAGTIVAVHEGVPLEVKYRIDCELDWHTRSVSIEQKLGFQRSTLQLSADGTGKWTDNRSGLVDTLTQCIDVDLELSPITNTLPINRLKLAVGQREEISAAWIRFPSLKLVHARQSYERLDSHTYRYCSLQSGFTADIEVDEIGLPIRYQGIWECVAVAER